MYKIGIVGHAEDKFSEEGKKRALVYISCLIGDYKLAHEDLVVVSGNCPIGGVDKWAEDCAKIWNVPTDIKSPKEHSWNGDYGFKARNLDIAKDSDIVYVILSSSFPKEYNKKRFTYCYHCKTDNHIKSGGCWTAHQAIRLGKKAEWVIINNE